MARKKRERDEDYGEFTVKHISAAPSNLFAVYYDPDEKDWNAFPVILFALGDVAIGNDIEKGVVRGMISNHGGLELAEENEHLEFIGYWRSDVQKDIKDFLEDHGIDEPPDEEEEDEDDEDDEDEDDDEEDEDD